MNYSETYGLINPGAWMDSRGMDVSDNDLRFLNLYGCMDREMYGCCDLCEEHC